MAHSGLWERLRAPALLSEVLDYMITHFYMYQETSIASSKTVSLKFYYFSQKPNLVRELRLSLQTPSNSDAASLVPLLKIHRSSREWLECHADCFLLLSRWARRVALQRNEIDSVASDTLEEAAAMAFATLRASGIDMAGASSLVFLSGYAAVLHTATYSTHNKIDSIAATVGDALVSSIRNSPLPLHCAAMSITGTLALFPFLSENQDAACWLVSALLMCLESLDERAPVHLIIDSLASMYSGARAAMATTVLLPTSIQVVYGVLRTVVMMPSPHNATYPSQLVAAAVLAAGGMLDGLSRTSQSAPHPINPKPFLNKMSVIRGLECLLLKASEHKSELVQAACSLAMMQCFEACKLPRPTVATTMCLTTTLVNTALGTRILCHVDRENVAQANEAIVEYSRCVLVQQATGLSAVASSHIGMARLSSSALAEVLGVIKNAARRTHTQYRQYIVISPSMNSVDVLPLRMVLEKLFSVSMALLAAVAAVPGRPQISGGAIPKVVLAVASDLQFCRTQMQSLEYAALLKSALTALPHQPASAVEVALLLPCLADLEVRHAAVHAGLPLWLFDGVTAAKVQLLFAALTPCCGILPQVRALRVSPRFTTEGGTTTSSSSSSSTVVVAVFGTSDFEDSFFRSINCLFLLLLFFQDILIDRVAPLCILYLRHPHQSTSAAAHNALCAMLATAPPPTTVWLAPRCVARWLDDGGLGMGAWSNDLILQQLAQGLSTALQSLPRQSKETVRVCINSVLEKSKMAAMAGVTSISASLFAIASQQLFNVHYAMVDEVEEALEECVMACAPTAWPALCAALFGILLDSDDCTRKPGIARWYQNVAFKLQ